MHSLTRSRFRLRNLADLTEGDEGCLYCLKHQHKKRYSLDEVMPQAGYHVED